MATKTKSFDAVAESRKWREATSRKLDAMSRGERLAYLHQETERIRAKMRAANPEPTVPPLDTGQAEIGTVNIRE
jgi:hypothetical protein